MRTLTYLLALLVVIAACGGDDDAADDATTTGAPEWETTVAVATTVPTDTTSTTVVAEATTLPPEDDATTTSAAASGDPECLMIWPEQMVQDELGEQWSYSEATIDGSVCSYTAIPASIGLAFRPGGQAEFDASRTGAEVTGTVVPVEACDAAFSIDIQGAIVIVEALDLDAGCIYSATMSGVEDAVEAATNFVKSAC